MSSRRLSFVTAAAALVAAASPAAFAQAGWTLIGFKTVSSGGDSDTIFVTDRRKFRSVRLCVFGRGIQLHDFDVRFGNGATQSLRVRSFIQPGTCTRAIDLKGNRRFVDRIQLRYNRTPGNGAPLVRVQAR